MKICGIFDRERDEEELGTIIGKMHSSLNHGSYGFDSFVTKGLGIGRLYSDIWCQDRQPIWNEDHSKFIVMAGKIFDYGMRRRELVARGHEFRHPRSDAEFILHGLEEWGDDLIRELNGVFVLAVYDAEDRTLTIANDRYGMNPLYYHYDQSSFVFASEVKAIIKDKKVKKEINWDGWRDFFSYGFLFGTKTLFKNVYAFPNATILTLTTNEALFKTYWSYNQTMVDYESSEQSFVNRGAKLIRQAIERQTEDLEECSVLLSGGYDSRCIASSIKYFTDVNFETVTTLHPVGIVDAILGIEIGRFLGVKNTYIPRPTNLVPKYLINKVFLLDGMCLEHLWILPLIDYLKKGKVNFDGIAGDILLGGSVMRDFLTLSGGSLADVHDDRKFALMIHQGFR